MTMIAGGRHIHADFDNGGRHQDSEPSVGEFGHHRILVGRPG